MQTRARARERRNEPVLRAVLGKAKYSTTTHCSSCLAIANNLQQLTQIAVLSAIYLISADYQLGSVADEEEEDEEN